LRGWSRCRIGWRADDHIRYLATRQFQRAQHVALNNNGFAVHGNDFGVVFVAVAHLDLVGPQRGEGKKKDADAYKHEARNPANF